jgi:hypothetical protein
LAATRAQAGGLDLVEDEDGSDTCGELSEPCEELWVCRNLKSEQNGDGQSVTYTTSSTKHRFNHDDADLLLDRRQ